MLACNRLNLNTTRCASGKLCPKETAADFGCGSLDQPDLQSLNDYIFFLLRFSIEILDILETAPKF